MTARQIKFGVHLGPLGITGSDTQHPIAETYNLAELVAVAQAAEAAKFDALFRADSPAFDKNLVAESNQPRLGVDAIVALTAVAAVTNRIGLVATASTSFNLPYNLARQFQSLDQLSRGRAGWNAVTSSAGERQFGIEELPRQERRYERAAEFLQVVQGLWASWGPDALQRDGDRLSVDPAQITEIDVHGGHFDVEGALGLPRSPQGWPVQFQAGASDTGKRFAGAYAEAIFSASPSFEHARRIAAEFKQLGRDEGRPEHLPLVFPGFNIVSEATTEAAQERYRARFDSVDFDKARLTLSNQFGGIDLDGLPLDQPIPADRLPDIDSLVRRQSRPGLFRELAERGLSLREILELHLSGNGHYVFVGSYDDVADELERWFTGGAADGFILGFLGGLTDFNNAVEHVLPRLQDRGLFRREYEADTLRGNLGLPLPALSAAR